MTDATGTTAGPSGNGTLVRSLGFWGLAAVILNGTVGAGIFALPGAVAHYAGSWVPLVVLGVGLAILPIVLVLPAIGSGQGIRPATEWSVSQAMILSVYAIIGFEGALCIAGEAIDPQRDFPRALVGVFVAVVLLYALLAWGYVASAYKPGVEDKASLLTMATALAGPVGMGVLLVTAVVSIFGITIVSTLLVSRRILALQQTGSLPDWFGVIRPEDGIPRNAVCVAVVVVTALSMSGGFTVLAALSVVSRLLIYLGCIASLPVVLRQGRHVLSPAVIVTLALATGGCVLLLAQVAHSAWTSLAVAMAIGLGARWTASRSIRMQSRVRG